MLPREKAIHSVGEDVYKRQQWYWVQYLNTKSFPTARGDYKLLTTVDAHGKQLTAVDADVVPGPMQGWPPFPFALTPKARQRGAITLKVDTVHITSAQMNDAFGERILRIPTMWMVDSSAM